MFILAPALTLAVPYRVPGAGKEMDLAQQLPSIKRWWGGQHVPCMLVPYDVGAAGVCSRGLQAVLTEKKGFEAVDGNVWYVPALHARILYLNSATLWACLWCPQLREREHLQVTSVCVALEKVA